MFASAWNSWEPLIVGRENVQSEQNKWWLYASAGFMSILIVRVF